ARARTGRARPDGPIPRRAARLRPPELPVHDGPRLLARDGESPADALRSCRLSGGAGRLDARPRRAQLRRHRCRVPRRPGRQADPRGGPRKHHEDLGDEHGRVVRPPLSREHPGLLRRQGRDGPRRRHRLPERAVPGAAELDRGGLPEPHLLQRSRRGQPLRGLAGARDLHERAPRRVQVTEEAVMSTVATATDVKPFQVEFAQDQIDELRRRITAARLPSKELVGDRSQGVQLATVEALAEYWAHDYDFARVEERLNALPQFTTEIDGETIHFSHVRSQHEAALPLIMPHGWPGSVIELLDSIGPLTAPTEHGGTAEDAFHLVLPSVPGYGFSSQPTELGWWAGRAAA